MLGKFSKSHFGVFSFVLIASLLGFERVSGQEKGDAIRSAGGDPTPSMREAFRYLEGLQSGQFSADVWSATASGEEAFHSESSTKSLADGSRHHVVLAYSKKLDAVIYGEETPTQISKQIFPPDRDRLLRYELAGNWKPGEEAKSLVERPDDYRTLDRVWGSAFGPVLGAYAHLMAPPIDRLLADGRWTAGPDSHSFVCRYKNLEMEFHTNPETGRLNRIVTHDLNSPGKVRADLQEWKTFAIGELPGRVRTRELWLDENTLITILHDFTLLTAEPLGSKDFSYAGNVPDIPDDNPVTVLDYKGIDFVWSDGEIVRAFDRQTLDGMLGKSFFPSPMRRWFLITLGIVTIGALGFFIWRWHRGRLA